MSEVERIFFYLPLEHSEAPEDQERSVEIFTDLLVDAREGFRDLIESTLQYAKDHKKVIDEFGRFPHRNKALGRDSTDAENGMAGRRRRLLVHDLRPAGGRSDLATSCCMARVNG